MPATGVSGGRSSGGFAVETQAQGDELLGRAVVAAFDVVDAAERRRAVRGRGGQYGREARAYVRHRHVGARQLRDAADHGRVDRVAVVEPAGWAAEAGV